MNTIRQLRAEHPELFHPNQDWFNEEPFMDDPLPDPMPSVTLTGAMTHNGIPPELISWHFVDMLPAVVLVHLYVMDPKALVWRNYLWSNTKDRLGQRVYVGCNGKGLELHRHIHVTHRFGVPKWE